MQSVGEVWGRGVKGVDQARHLFLRGQGVKKMCCDVGKLYEIQTSMSISQVLLEPSQTHPFAYFLWLLSHSMSASSSCDRDHVAHDG